jgi:sporulation protein YlmC with PRC-barrel domain/DNA-directed RNA polymerase subunit RPC12/RpoP
MMAEDTMAEKKLRGSGGYAIARITDEEQKKGNLGGPELFLAGIGRLDDDRFVKYHCNKCEKEYEGAPAVVYENPNEQLGEGVTLIEKGEYKCKTCNATIAQYRKFDTPALAQQTTPAMAQQPKKESPVSPNMISATTPVAENFVPIQSLVGMSAYDSEAMLIGKVEEIGLRKAGGNAHITIKVGGKEIGWGGISKIGDIVLLGTTEAKQASGGRCHACGYQNEVDAAFCADCGSKL